MIVNQGRTGRILLVEFESGDNNTKTMQTLIEQKDIRFAIVLAPNGTMGIVSPRPENGMPTLSMDPLVLQTAAYAVIQEISGIPRERVSRTSITAEPAQTPAPAAPGTVPIYLFNAEFN